MVSSYMTLQLTLSQPAEPYTLMVSTLSTLLHINIYHLPSWLINLFNRDNEYYISESMPVSPEANFHLYPVIYVTIWTKVCLFKD